MAKSMRTSVYSFGLRLFFNSVFSLNAVKEHNDVCLSTVWFVSVLFQRDSSVHKAPLRNDFPLCLAGTCE